MFRFLQERQKQKQLTQSLLNFFQEIEDNFEAYYVMFQINRLRFFSTEVWFKVSENPAITVNETIKEYTRRLIEYNAVLTDFKEYETWYSSNIKHKTKENGLVLQAKRDAAQAKFDAGLEGIIKAALTSLQDELISKQIIKYKSRFLERS